MTILANFKRSPVTVISALVLDKEQLETLKSNIDEISEFATFNGSIEISELENGFSLISCEGGLKYKAGDQVFGPQKLLAPILKENQFCRAVTFTVENGEVDVEDISFGKHYALTDEEVVTHSANLKGQIDEIKSLKEVPKAQMYKIHDLSGLNWNRYDTIEEYFATSAFKISPRNAEKLSSVLSMYEWGEYDNPEIIFNEETGLAYISGGCADHGTIDWDCIDDDEEADIEETIEITELVKEYADPDQAITMFVLSFGKYSTYYMVSTLEI